ncbi:MAG: hypothetical protein ACPKM1_18745, partial [Spirochaetaceae bacterium]
MEGLSPLKLLLILIFIITILILCYVFFIFHENEFINSSYYEMINLDAKDNVASALSSFMFFLSGIQLMVIANIKKNTNRYSLPWAFMALILLTIAIDEKYSLHKTINSYYWII